ncbi:hypothetical protein BC628DRAFT_1353064 [Trametes gibbosa]|nr:hypothetical protein BC628DRAFT_1353064 [Trametes gibbosa]
MVRAPESDRYHARPSYLPYRKLYSSGERPALQTAMGLEHDGVKFKKYVKIMRECAQKLYPREVPTLSELVQEDEDAFARMVLLRAPDLRYYEDGWVSSTYLRHWLRVVRVRGVVPKQITLSLRTNLAHPPQQPRRRQHTHRLRLDAVSPASPAATTRDKASRPRQECAQQRPPHGPRRFIKIKVEDVVPEPVVRVTPQPTAPRSSPHPRVCPRRVAVATHASVASPRREAPTKGPPPPTTSSSTISSARADPLPGRDKDKDRDQDRPRLGPVHHFLRSLAEPLECLYPALHAIGLRDEASLCGLVRMPGWYGWLLDLLRHDPHRGAVLTDIQWKHLVDGLYRLEKEDAGEEP